MNLDLTKIKKVHFIGIGGIGISAIARMMLLEGKEVTGQDLQDSGIVSELKKVGAQIEIGQSFEKIPKDVDLIVYTIAIEYYDPELFKKLKEQNVPLYSYPQMLGLISNNKYTIAVSGTHGKTTTTGMIAQILCDQQKDPTVIIGSLLKGKTNFIAGKSEYFIVEACEYRKSFLNINPKILVITNIDADHLDYYKDIEDIKNAFHEMAMQVPVDGYVICDMNDQNILDTVKNIKAKIINYQEFFNLDLKLKVPGIHNKKNAAAALAVADILKIKEENAQKSLQGFLGTWRRLEKRGETKEGTIIYDDYAHHPTEIKASLQALRELYPKEGEGSKKITVLFQPHLYSRTKALFGDFVKSFNEADQVLLLPIYFAREAKDESISSEKLAEAIRKNGLNTEAFTSFELAENAVAALNLGENDVFVTMGAGEAYKVADKVFKLV